MTCACGAAMREDTRFAEELSRYNIDRRRYYCPAGHSFYQPPVDVSTLHVNWCASHNTRKPCAACQMMAKQMKGTKRPPYSGTKRCRGQDCGKEFTPLSPNQVYCKDCTPASTLERRGRRRVAVMRHHRHYAERVCKRCHQPFVPKTGNAKYCDACHTALASSYSREYKRRKREGAKA